MAKVPKDARAPGFVRFVLTADRTQRIVVAWLIMLACWGATEVVLAPMRAPWWAYLALAAFILLHGLRVLTEVRGGLRHLDALRSTRAALRETERLAARAHSHGDLETLAKCEARLRNLGQRHQFHLLGVRGELPKDQDA